MLREKRYIFNEKTLSYEVYRKSPRQVILRIAAVLATGLGCFLLYFHLYTVVLGYPTPKEAFLASRNRTLLAQLEAMDEDLDRCGGTLDELARRDNIVYRPIFGMDEIPSDVRDAGFAGTWRHGLSPDLEHSDFLASTAMKADALTRKAYVQSKSFDDVTLLAKRADDMASCVPSICPVKLSRVQVTSTFGYRVHPISNSVSLHGGIDLAGPRGEPVVATGNGVVEDVLHNFFGYGNMVVIDHGFGYKTRYAHLQEVCVRPGQRVTRGEQVATLGSSGRSTGPHLHYEVLYKDKQINPWNFLSNSMSPEEYAQITSKAGRRR